MVADGLKKNLYSFTTSRGKPQFKVKHELVSLYDVCKNGIPIDWQCSCRTGFFDAFLNLTFEETEKADTQGSTSLRSSLMSHPLPFRSKWHMGAVEEKTKVWFGQANREAEIYFSILNGWLETWRSLSFIYAMVLGIQTKVSRADPLYGREKARNRCQPCSPSALPIAPWPVQVDYSA